MSFQPEVSVGCRGTATAEVVAAARRALLFRWVSSYMGAVDYEVIDETEVYRVTVREEAGVYLRSIYNGTPEEFERDVVGEVGLIHRHADVEVPIPGGTVEAFNRWRFDSHQLSLDQMDAQPERFGVISADDPLRKPPVTVIGGHYALGRGWVREG